MTKYEYMKSKGLLARLPISEYDKEADDIFRGAVDILIEHFDEIYGEE